MSAFLLFSVSPFATGHLPAAAARQDELRLWIKANAPLQGSISFCLIGPLLLPRCPHTLSLQGMDFSPLPLRSPCCHTPVSFTSVRATPRSQESSAAQLEGLPRAHRGLLGCSSSSPFPTPSSRYSLSHSVWPWLNCKLENDQFSSSLCFQCLCNTFNMAGTEQVQSRE